MLIFDTLDNAGKGIKLKTVDWTVTTAGPSPFNNERTELFLLGCKRATNGTPCLGCFNPTTWDDTFCDITHDPYKMAEHINRCSPNKYITIGGGEPSDQIENLIILCKELKKYGFHIMVYTWRRLLSVLNNDDECINVNEEHSNNLKNNFNELLNHIDILTDGEFIIEEKLWNGNAKDGFISSVGSGNQIIWDVNKRIGYYMRDLKGLRLNTNNDLEFDLINDNKILIN